MGLDTTHDAFHGAYSAFNRFRQMVCFVLGGSFPPHYQYNEDFTFKPEVDGLLPRRTDLDENAIYFGVDLDEGSGLYEFLCHSDCDGEISPEKCVKVADELEALLPKIEAIDNGGVGHIAARGGYAGVTRKFIAGCREAAAAGEPLGFH
jgi:hypothetical protein